MLRISFSEELKDDSLYQTIMVSETETVRNILTRRNINPQTRNVFLNGSLVNEESLGKTLKEFGIKSATLFLTVKFKTVDRPRRASSNKSPYSNKPSTCAR